MNQRKVAMQKELTGNNPQQMLFTEELTTTKPRYPFNSTRQEIEHKFKKFMHEDLKLGSVDSYVGNKTDPFLRRFKADFYVHLDWHVGHYVNVMIIHNSKDLLNEGGGK